MKPIALEARVAAPLDRVFEAFTDFEHVPGRCSGITKIEMLTPGPARVGTRFRETRTMFGTAATETMEITRLEPGRAYTLSCTSCGVRYDSTLSFRAEGGSTVVAQETTCQPISLGAKVFAPITGALMRRSMTKLMSKDLDDLKRSIENTTT